MTGLLREKKNSSDERSHCIDTYFFWINYISSLTFWGWGMNRFCFFFLSVHFWTTHFIINSLSTSIWLEIAVLTLNWLVLTLEVNVTYPILTLNSSHSYCHIFRPRVQHFGCLLIRHKTANFTCIGWLVIWVLGYINHCRLFNANSIFIKINSSISNNLV